MRLLVADCDPKDVKLALHDAPLSGASILTNPAYLNAHPDEEDLWVACGAPAVKMIQAAGWIPKQGGVVSLHGKLFSYKHEAWDRPISVGVTYAPQIRHIDYTDFVNFLCDISVYKRFEKTGSMEPKLGNYAYVRNLKGVIDFISEKYALTGQPVEVALDLETMGLYPQYPDKNILTVQLTAEIGLSDVVYVPDLTEDELAELISDMHWICTTTKVKMVGANLKFDMGWLREKWGIVIRNFVFDTCNAGSLVEENRPNSLNIHTKIYSPELGGYDDPFNQKYKKMKGSMEKIPKSDILPYAGGDTDACLRNYYKIRAELLSDNVTQSGKPAKNSLTSLYMNVVSPALIAIHKMEHHGVCVDVDKFHEFGSDLNARMKEDMRYAADLIPGPILDKHGGLVEGGAPLSKPHMIADFLFTPLGLNLQPKILTSKDKKPSTAQEHLAMFKDVPEAAPLVERYMSYKQVSKMYGTYYKGFLNHLRPDDRWHASYIIHRQGADGNNEQAAAGTVTGRGSATDPAFQCVAGDTEIMTPDGVRTAAELIDGSGVSDHIPMVEGEQVLWTLNGWDTSTLFFRSWRHDLVKVILHNGVELTCTPEHPVLCLRGWVKAEQLQPDDFLRPIKPVPRRHAKPWLSKEFAWALGVIDADGYVSKDHVEVPDYWAPALKDILKCNEVDHFEGRAIFHCRLLSGYFNDIRGTEFIYDYLRGYWEAGGQMSGSDRNAKITLRRLSSSHARKIVHEGMTGGMPGAYIIERENGLYDVEFRGRAAKEFCTLCGVGMKQGWSPTAYDNQHRNMRQGLQVRRVIPAGAGYVYDFTVPDNHSFTANGLMVHNTVPKHSYWGKRIRECIIAPPGYRIAGLDYSQGELKLTACWADESNMIKAYKNGIDLHVLTSGTVNGMSYEEALNLKKMNPEAYDVLRQGGKAGNFGLIYGMQAHGFMHYASAVYGVDMDLEEATHFRNTFFEKLYPGLTDWHNRQIAEALQYGYVRSPFGRLRHLHNIKSPNKSVRSESERQAINSPIQGTLGDMMWWAMGIVEREREGEIIPFGNVHDQGLWYVREDFWEEDTRYLKETMENLPIEKTFGWKPQLAFTVDAEVGSNLAGIEKVAL